MKDYDDVVKYNPLNGDYLYPPAGGPELEAFDHGVLEAYATLPPIERYAP